MSTQQSSSDTSLRGEKRLAKATLRDYLCSRSSSIQECLHLDTVGKPHISAISNGEWNKAAKNVVVFYPCMW